eukprot:ANDGO_02161.mRNA.1 COP9 signalosome complex subunit 8
MLSLQEYGVQEACNASAGSPQFYAEFILACIAEDKLPSARLVHKRFHSLYPQYSSDAVVRGCFELVRDLWNHDFQSFFQHAQELSSSSVGSILASELVPTVRRRVLFAISNTYSDLSLHEACSFLGIPLGSNADADAAVSLFTPLGWKIDSVRQIVYPVRGSVSCVSKTPMAAKEDPNTPLLASLSSYAQFLDLSVKQ